MSLARNICFFMHVECKLVLYGIAPEDGECSSLLTKFLSSDRRTNTFVLRLHSFVQRLIGILGSAFLTMPPMVLFLGTPCMLRPVLVFCRCAHLHCIPAHALSCLSPTSISYEKKGGFSAYPADIPTYIAGQLAASCLAT